MQQHLCWNLSGKLQLCKETSGESRGSSGRPESIMLQRGIAARKEAVGKNLADVPEKEFR
jgi:hypothetical protein